MMSIRVVLPAPLGPMKQRNSPGALSRESLLIALKPSKLTLTSSRYRMRPWVTSTSPGVAMREKPAARPPDSVLPGAVFSACASARRAPSSSRSGVMLFPFQLSDEPDYTIWQEQGHTNKPVSYTHL